MKLALSLILCVSLPVLSLSARCETTNRTPNVTLCEVAFVLACAAIAGYLVVTISGGCPNKTDKVMVYVDESKDGRATWKCIATNGPIVLNGTDPLEVYRHQITDDAAFYRARVKKVAQ